MIKSITVTNPAGESLVLELRSPEQSGFFVRKVDGLGPSKTNINITQSLGLSGGYFNSAHSETRNIVMDLGFYNWTAESIETIRQKTYRYFPLRKPIIIEVETDNRIGVTEGYVESNEPDIFSKEESAQISIICPSSHFVAKEPIETLFTGLSGGFEFPFMNDSLTQSLIEFSSVVISTQKNIVYSGDEDTGIYIYARIVGPVNNLAIHDLTSGRSLTLSSSIITSMTGFDLKAGDELFISTIVGSKFVVLVRNGVEINILNALSVTGGWITLENGDNEIVYTASSGASNLYLTIEHNVIYMGM